MPGPYCIELFSWVKVIYRVSWKIKTQNKQKYEVLSSALLKDIFEMCENAKKSSTPLHRYNSEPRNKINKKVG